MVGRAIGSVEMGELPTIPDPAPCTPLNAKHELIKRKRRGEMNAVDT